MGGKLIKKFGLEEKRISKQEYVVLVNEVLAILNDCINSTYLKYITPKVKVVPCYRNKEDFGDMDILIEIRSMLQK